VPAEFFAHVLGPHRKYSCCWYPEGAATLEEAERASLELTCEHADLEDGMDVLELGCGWGSLTLFMAERYPGSRITAVSNSSSQRESILGRARERGLGNLEVITADVNAFEPEGHFDRVVSVEMFEHMRNWEELLRRIAGWIRPEGRALIHVFRHRERAYLFRTDGPANWMGRHFFTGGLMPGRELFREFAEDLAVTRIWDWDGTHYARTSEAWLRNLDRSRAEVMPILESTYGKRHARRWFRRWRVFFMACAELFGHAGGSEWGVSHYRLEPARRAARVEVPS
jgi:cyclopropane-fatty-acyl-phospholipid synthase